VALALVALLVQLVLPGATAFAMGDPLGHAPICTGTVSADHGAVPGSGHKALHAACPFCQAPAVAWGFLPPPAPELAAPGHLASVAWRDHGRDLTSGAVAGARARGPPGAA
jgi:hypothetical protein